MPAYDYRCAECGEIFELTARMGQAPSDPACPKDDGGAGVRVFGAGVAIHTGGAPGARSAATARLRRHAGHGRHARHGRHA